MSERKPITILLAEEISIVLELGMGNIMLAGSDGCGTRLIQFPSTSRAQKFEPSKKLSWNF